MTPKTILDLYRLEHDAPRDQHYFHFFPGGKSVLSTAEYFRRTAGLAAGSPGSGFPPVIA